MLECALVLKMSTGLYVVEEYNRIAIITVGGVGGGIITDISPQESRTTFYPIQPHYNVCFVFYLQLVQMLL